MFQIVDVDSNHMDANHWAYYHHNIVYVIIEMHILRLLYFIIGLNESIIVK